MRGLTLSGHAPLAPARLLPVLAGSFGPRLRAPPKQSLASVPLRDLELEAQYEQIRVALARYADASPPPLFDGQVSCPSCSTVCSEEDPACICGTFLHFHQVFTCPGCHTVVARDDRDCTACGASFWSPVNPPRSAITEGMVADYLERMRVDDR
ncbi:MAG TPA: hypothetical protein VGB42_00195 [Candidatus Thermoplasmatota archaeon]